MQPITSRRSFLAGLVLASAMPRVGRAQAFEADPIQQIVPREAGGGADAMARIIASLLQRELERPVGVRNRADATGVRGHTALAEAPADGSVIGMVTTELAMMHWRGLTTLTPGDVTPLALMNVEPAALLVRADSRIDDMRDLLVRIRTKSGFLTASGSPEGGIWHLALVGMLQSLGIPATAMRWRPSSETAPALQDLLEGRVDLVVSTIPDASAPLNAGLVRPLAIMDSTPNPGYPQVPTLQAATGSPWTIAAWRGIAAPPGLPQPQAIRLAQALNAVYTSPEFAAFMSQRGFTPAWAAREAFAAFMDSSDERLGAALRAAGLAR